MAKTSRENDYEFISDGELYGEENDGGDGWSGGYSEAGRCSVCGRHIRRGDDFFVSGEGDALCPDCVDTMDIDEILRICDVCDRADLLTEMGLLRHAL